jgi:hypothetical protein
MGALVEIAEVSQARPLPAAIQGGFLDQPHAGAVLDAEAVDVFGWAVAAGPKAVAVEFSSGGAQIARAPLRSPRPDLADAFPERPDAACAGFRTTIDLVGTEPEFELDVSVVLADRSRAPLGTVRGSHRWRRQRDPAFAELVSVVIVGAGEGEGDRLASAIEGAREQASPRLEIVVVGEDEPGPAVARNLGIRSTNGDFLVFLDAGEPPPPGALEAGLRALERQPECAAAFAPAGSAAPAVYRRSLFEHLRTFDPRLGAAAALGFDLAVARRFPVAGQGDPPPGADELSERLREALATEAKRSLRHLRLGQALREVSLLARTGRG